MKKPIQIFFIILSFIAVLSIQTILATEADLHVVQKAEVVKRLGKLPAFFIENQGQMAEEVRYYFKGNDSVYFTDGAVVFQKIDNRKGQGLVERGEILSQPMVAQKDHFSYAEQGEASSQPDVGVQELTEALAYRLEFIGANPTSPKARNALQGKVNYFIGNNPSKWQSNLPTYQEVIYPELYKGVDLVYRGVHSGVKYEFVVHPGANPDDIRLAYTGIDGLSIDDSGNLIINTALGDVKDKKPYAYQEIERRQVKVECRFRIQQSAVSNTPPAALLGEKRSRDVCKDSSNCVAGNPLYQEGIRGCVNAIDTVNGLQKYVYGFSLAEYDPRYPLIIDPGLEYSTFLGGSGGESGLGIAVDASGSAYVTGATYSSDFPTTTGAFDTTFNLYGLNLYGLNSSKLAS